MTKNEYIFVICSRFYKKIQNKYAKMSIYGSTWSWSWWICSENMIWLLIYFSRWFILSFRNYPLKTLEKIIYVTMEVNIQQFECNNCHRNLFNQNNLEPHKKICGYDYKSRNNFCDKCDKYFATPNALSDHLLTCGHFICYESNIPFIHPKALNYHIGNHFSYITNFEKLVQKFQCDKCLKWFKCQWNLRRHYSVRYNKTVFISW